MSPKKIVKKKIAKIKETGTKKEQVRVLSTGSTILDLAISGKIYPEGGIPEGIIVEIFGPSATGKTAILSELAASCQIRGGETLFQDPEKRLDKEYCKKYGIDLSKMTIKVPKTIEEYFEFIYEWETSEDKLKLVGGDSIAALSTIMERESEDKMGMRKGKVFYAELRKKASDLQENNYLIVFTNHELEGTSPTGQKTYYTPGGTAVKYWSSLRIRLRPGYPQKAITVSRKLNGKEFKRKIGIFTDIEIVKSSIDNPHRTCTIPIVFGYGIDDIRGNLMFLKQISGSRKYECLDKDFSQIDHAIKYVEENGYEKDLKEIIIQEWHKHEDSFKTERKRKERV